MTATNLGTASPTEQPEAPPDDKKHIKIRFCVFFDGTLNNRTNIEQRLLARAEDDAKQPDQHILTAEERKALADLTARAGTSGDDLARKIESAKGTYKDHGAKSADEENSYEGFYANVEKMERYLDAGKGKTPGYQFTFKTYIEGAGSVDTGGDQMPGYAFGMSFLVWRAGIPDKVKKGLRDVVKQIKRQSEIRSNTVIDELTLDTFGFSRGAAAARNFIYEALNDEEAGKLTPSLQTRLKHEWLDTTQVKVHFAGLYDTVSTYGPGTIVGAADNVETLNLDAVSNAEAVLHLTSADEHRYHFSLTDIRSAGGKGKEYCLPGVHSDIGGGYRDNAFQNLTLRGSEKIEGLILHGNYPTLDEANADRSKLMAEGWYHEDELTVSPVCDMDGNVLYATMKAERKGKRRDPAELQQTGKTSNIEYEGIRSGYSRIPLNIMTKETRQQGIVFTEKFDLNETVPDELSDIKERLESHASGPSKTDFEIWKNNREGWLTRLRHDYLHFSARMTPGHDPRIEDKQRKRKVYPG